MAGAPRRPPKRVLVEEADYDEGLRLAGALRQAGYDVSVCPGPETAGRGSRRCPLVHDDDCTLVDRADVVVAGLGFAGPERRDVFEALRGRRASKPVVALVTPSEAGWLPDLGEGCAAVARPADPAGVAAAVTEALSVVPQSASA